jgi:hypothetical protein
MTEFRPAAVRTWASSVWAVCSIRWRRFFSTVLMLSMTTVLR